MNPALVVEGGGFEPPKLTRQIYSLIPLAAREPLQKEALDSAFEHGGCQIKFDLNPLFLNVFQQSAQLLPLLLGWLPKVPKIPHNQS